MADPMKRIMNKNLVGSALTALMGFALGCAPLTVQQKSAVSGFSWAAASVGSVTAAELATMRDETIAMTTQRLLLGGKSKDPRLADMNSLDRGFDLDRIEVVINAANALQNYGSGLACLVQDGQTPGLRDAANQFAANLGRIPEIRDSMNANQIGFVGALVQQVGGFWVESKRKKAVTTLVLSTQAVIDKLCDLLIRDFDPNGGWVSLQLLVVEEPLKAEAMAAFDDATTYAQRKPALEALEMAYTSQLERTELLQRIVAAALAMKKANAALAQALNKPAYTIQDLQDFGVKCQSLQGASSILSSIRR